MKENTVETNHELSDKAYAYYAKVKEQGDRELARLYLVNAITHSPNIVYIRQYVDDLKREDDADREEILPQAMALLSQAALNGSPDDVVEIRQLVESLQQEDVRDDAPEIIDDNSEKLKQAFLDFSWDRMERRDELFDLSRLAEKAEMLQKALESEVLSDDEAEDYAQMLKETQAQLNFASLCKEFDRIHEMVSMALLVQGEFDKIFKAQTIAGLQQLSSILSQLWTMKDDGPFSLNANKCFKNRIKMMQLRFEEMEEKTQEFLGREVFDGMCAKIEEFNREDAGCADNAKRESESLPTDKTWTKHIQSGQKLIAEIRGALQQLPYKEHRDKLLADLDRIEKLVASWSVYRYARYQRIVADLCKKAVDKWNENTTVNKDEARGWLKDYKFTQIDESLLSPEAAGVFHDIKAKLANKFNSEEMAEFEYHCIVDKKMKLESL